MSRAVHIHTHTHTHTQGIQKIESAKKFMQVGVDVKCMETKYGGGGLSTFGNIACLQKQPNFPFGPWTIVHGHQKI